MEDFRAHEQSDLHRVATQALTAQLRGKAVDVALATADMSAKGSARKVLVAIISAIKVLARQGLAMRGSDVEEEGNLHQFLISQKETLPEIEAWLLNGRSNYTSARIQNEVIELLANRVRSVLKATLQKSPFFAIIADEARDSGNKEQVSVCVR